VENEQYRFGACVAGHAERRRRYGYAGVAYLVAVGYLGLVLAVDAEPLVVGLVVPLALGTEWLLQARESLCRRLGLRGSSPERSPGLSRCGASRATHRAARRRALVLTLTGLATGVVGTVGVVLALWLA
jgi:hypothetical protein